MSKFSYSWIGGLLTFGLTLTMFPACDDEPPPNDPPVLINAGAEAKCELRAGLPALMSVRFTIEDLQGSNTLLLPLVEFNNIAIEMTPTPIPAPTPEEITAAMESGAELPVCGHESCRMEYTWDYQAGADSALIGCEEGDRLFIRILDEDNNDKSAYLPVSL